MSGPRLSTMAWRNMWRNGRRTLITLFSISFGILLAVMFTGIGDSTYSDMIDLAAKMGAGHVTLQHPEYLELPALNRTVQDIKAKRKKALLDRNVDKVVERISGPVMLSTAANSTGAFFIAIDPKAENDATLSILDAIKQGEMFATSRDKGIILGKRLADNLDARMGRKVVYTMTDKKGEIITGLGRVSGIIETGAPTVDGGLVLLPIDIMRDALGYAPDEATQVALFIDDQRRSAAVAARLSDKVGTDVAVLTWSETQPDLASFIAMKVAGTIFFEVLIMILIAAGIFNTLFVSVMERIREFGIMMAIGFSPANLFRLVMWESLWLGIVGVAAGVLITAWPYHYFNTTGLDYSGMLGEEGAEVAGVAMEPVMHIGIYPESAIVIGLVVILSTLAAGLYPAWRAGRVAPVESIKLV